MFRVSLRCLTWTREQDENMSFFFFQAEDGIRDVAVTGVQTCALPILLMSSIARYQAARPRCAGRSTDDCKRNWRSGTWDSPEPRDMSVLPGLGQTWTRSSV